MPTQIRNRLVGLQGFLHTSFIRKVVGLSLISTLMALVSAFAVFQWLDWRGDEEDLSQAQLEVTRHMGRAIADGIADNAHSIFLADQNMSAAIYFPAEGRPQVFVRSGADAPALRPRGQSTAYIEDRIVNPEIYVPVWSDGRRIGELVAVANSRDNLEKLWRNTLILLGVSSISVILGGATAALLAVRTLRPLHALNRAIEDVRRTKDFAATVAVTSQDEIGRLTENFNALLADLEVYSHSLQAARDTAEEATRLKSEFLANMSHEIRTPLNGVLGMAQVMATSTLTPVQRERLDVIQRSGASLLAVLNDILDLSKIEAGRLEIESAPFDIQEVAEGACAVFTSVANGKGLSFGLHIDAAARGAWRGDSVRVRQLLYNLISNAIKFTAEGSVQVRIARGEREGGGDLILISVADTGIGVAPDDLPKLFEKFTQADSSTTRRFGGTGLGLTICRHIAELMGGGIAAFSDVGKGSRFDVSLPFDHLGSTDLHTGEEAGDADETAFDISALRVLAAEDNETNQLVLKTILHSLGLEPVVVADGRQAVQAWATGGYDLILMDVQMPVMDGVDATREIRSREAAGDLPRTRIVALSANAMSHQVAEYVAAGMDGHLPKPLAIPHLHAVLVDACRAAEETARAA